MTQKFIYQELIDKLAKDEPCTSRELKSALVDLEVKLNVQKMYVQQLRDGLKFYLPGPFWTEVFKDTKAAADLGRHANWVLQTTDPDSSVNA